MVEYILPLRIDGAQRIGNESTLLFVAQPGQIYFAEYCDAPSTNAWQSLAYVWTPSDATRFQVTDSTDALQRFYRLATSQ